jgi:hypothetical protein
MKREIELFHSSGPRIVETTLSECCEEVGPLLGNLHRKHGAEDSDADTTRYLKSQAAVLDNASRVFLEVEQDRPVGFSLCYEWGNELHVRVVGFNYDCSSRFAYFNLAYYLPLEYAIGRGMDCIHVGAGTYGAKVSRGGVLEPLWSVVWPPDDQDAAWFEACKQAGEDAREAQRYLPLLTSDGAVSEGFAVGSQGWGLSACRTAVEDSERVDRYEQQGVDAGLLVGRTAAAKFGDCAAVLGLGGELADPGGKGGVHQRWRGGARPQSVWERRAIRRAWPVPGEFGDGLFGAGVNEVLVGGRGSDNCGGGGVVQSAGQPVGDAVQPDDVDRPS